MNLAIRITAAILSVPPDVIAPMLPMIAPPPRNQAEYILRDEIDSVLSGSCSSAIEAPLFALGESETSFVNCATGLPLTDGDLYKMDEDNVPSTYGEITVLGARQLFHQMGLYSNNCDVANHQFFDLGSGGGRLVIQSYLELPSVCRSVGVELSPTRHEIAMTRLNNLKSSGDLDRIRQLASRVLEKSDGNLPSKIDLYQGDLFQLDISEATHIYISSLCFTDEMLERIVHKMESEATSLQIVASLRLLPLRKSSAKRIVRLGDKPWQEFIEMTWNKGDGCPVYFYSVKR